MHALRRSVLRGLERQVVSEGLQRRLCTQHSRCAEHSPNVAADTSCMCRELMTSSQRATTQAVDILYPSLHDRRALLLHPISICHASRSCASTVWVTTAYYVHSEVILGCGHTRKASVRNVTNIFGSRTSAAATRASLRRSAEAACWSPGTGCPSHTASASVSVHVCTCGKHADGLFDVLV